MLCSPITLRGRTPEQKAVGPKMAVFRPYSGEGGGAFKENLMRKVGSPSLDLDI